MVAVTSLVDRLRRYDSTSDKSDPYWGFHRTQLIRNHNRWWYGYENYQVPNESTVFYSAQDHPDVILTNSGTNHIVDMLKAWFGRVDPIGSEYNIFQRYGISLIDLLNHPQQIITALSRVRSEEIEKGK